MLHILRQWHFEKNFLMYFYGDNMANNKCLKDNKINNEEK